ncbi:DUF4260 domain-containing protein [Parapedobacter tibetensis]|uniref:DUF4260 domain-containing protein n=1 Tax=Parapedobacter tibetensis TaxID=2972951 RepID=UPI00214D4F63|nr:DUF4260 domain-containing protein [Parapedobacter tibetensis]
MKGYHAEVKSHPYKMVAVAFWGMGIWLHIPLLALTGAIMFGHSAMDRIFGYGLKFWDNFKNTHLGWIGKID